MRFPGLGRSITVVLVTSAAVATSASAQLPPVPSVEPPPLPQAPTVEPPALPPLPVPEVGDVPDVPEIPAPVPPLPDPPPVLAPAGGGASSGESTTSPRGGSGRTQASAGATGSAATVAGGAASAGGDGGATAPRRPGISSRGREATRPAGNRRTARQARRERRLRQTVTRLSGCLGAIRPAQRRVLVLRAGLGAADPLTRAAVAERLEMTRRAVRRTERRGLRALRAAARVGCAPRRSGGWGGERTVDTVAFHLGALRDERGGGTAGTAAGHADEPAQGGVKEEFRSRPGGAPGATLTPPSVGGAGGGPPVAVLVALAFLAGFALVWIFERRRA